MQVKENLMIKKSYNGIDLMKLICAILVIAIHVPPFGENNSIELFENLNFFIKNYLARIAVPFFFVASGFFLYKKMEITKLNLDVIKKYCKNILRLYIIWSLIYLPLILIVFLKNGNGVVYNTLSYIRSFLFVGSYKQLWYLNSLIVAVLIISFLLYKKVKPKNIIIIAAILYFIGLFADSWFGFILPLEKLTPTIWSVLKLVQKVIVTTRNGLFDGFLFVAIGMCFAFYNININKKKTIIGFILSMILMLLEAVLLEHYNIPREYNMYLFLVPATIFLFVLAKNIEFPSSNKFKAMRSLSALIFYTHLLVDRVIVQALKIATSSLETTFVRFILTLICTIIFSYIILKISDKPKFKWLKKIYS